MKILLLLTLLAVAVESQEQTGFGCRWRYKCCELIQGSCVRMCDPEIYCPEETTTEKSLFAPAQALNVKCKFGFKPDKRNDCRRVLK